jgi:hypothetical protein
MKPGDKAALVFFGVATIACAAALFLPIVQEGQATRGISGAFGLPAWVLVSGGTVLFAMISAVIIANNVRRDK